jgi:hypothetical protein
MSRRPDFFIAGFPKCATTSLYEYLKGHPDIFMSPAKEPRYFDQAEEVGGRHDRDFIYPDDEQRYLKLFAGATDEKRVGEATPGYIYSETAATRIKAFQPDARFIIMVRDPIQMIQSLHSQLVEAGRENATTLEMAVRPEPEGHRQFFINRASYADHLGPWFETFGRDRFHLMVMEDLNADPAGTYELVLRFLEVDPTYRPEFVAHNRRFATRFMPIRRLARTRVPQWILWRALPAVVGDAPVRRTVRKFQHSALGRKEARPKSISPKLHADLRRELEPGVAKLSGIFERDLAALWWGRPPAKVPQAVAAEG